jgi:sugar phosphate isomerase/epimerase
MKNQNFTFFSLVLLLAACFDLSAQQGKPLYTAPFGVQLYTYRMTFPKNAVGILDSIKMLGITEVEGDGGRIAPDDFRKLCDARGIKIPSTGAGYEELVNKPMEVVQKAKTLGARYVMCAWIPHKFGSFSIVEAKKAVEDFNKAGKILRENGLTLCYHFHGYEFQPHEGGTLFDYIADNTNPKYVSFEMDVFWIVFGGGDPVALLNKYGKRWKLMHLKDMKKDIEKNKTGGTNVEFDVALGTGQIDFAPILKAAKKAKVKHYFLEDESSRIHQQVPQSIAYLKSLR